MVPDLIVSAAGAHIEAHFGPIVPDGDAWYRAAIIVPDAHHKDMGPLPLAIDGQLGKHCADLQRHEGLCKPK